MITDYNKCYEGNRILGEKLTGQLRFSGKGRLLRMWHLNRHKRKRVSMKKTFQIAWTESTKPEMRMTGMKNQQKVSVNRIRWAKGNVIHMILYSGIWFNMWCNWVHGIIRCTIKILYYICGINSSLPGLQILHS